MWMIVGIIGQIDRRRTSGGGTEALGGEVRVSEGSWVTKRTTGALWVGLRRSDSGSYPRCDKVLGVVAVVKIGASPTRIVLLLRSVENYISDMSG